ncbi:GNAT family N-acetyltransferase [Polycladidibacter stylochi]|uniref:GNAT family N-acetyltransferase n=1 Tax=Polycladidibacter stylochi TaxID=1807766 RepID=UPI000830DB4D|nr:GNAT family N-acetyltransferase [Pseudovibrio stylochi]
MAETEKLNVTFQANPCQSLKDLPPEVIWGWRDLQSTGVFGPFQSYEWCEAYTTHMAQTERAEYFIVSGSYEGRIVFIFPMTIYRRGGAKILKALADPINGENVGLWCAEFHALAKGSSLDRQIRNLARQSGVDIINLRNIPQKLIGKPNPVASVHNKKSSVPIYGMQLSEKITDILNIYQSESERDRLSAERRRLHALGNTMAEMVVIPYEKRIAINSMQNHHNKRQRRTGEPPFIDSKNKRAFLEALISNEDQRNPLEIEIYRLKVSGAIRSLFIGIKCQDSFHCLAASTDQGFIGTLNPQSVLLYEMLSDMCNRGFKNFYFHPGTDALRASWGKKVEMQDWKQALTLKGRLVISFTNPLLKLRERLENYPKIKRVFESVAKIYRSIRYRDRS